MTSIKAGGRNFMRRFAGTRSNINFGAIRDDGSPKPVKLRYVFRDAKTAKREVNFAAKRLVAARMAIPYLQRAELGHAPALPKAIKRSMVTRFKPEGDKVMRLHAQTGTIEHGFVHLPREAHWLADYLHELTVFPNGRHDDQVDSTSQALAWTKLRPSGWAIYEIERREYEKARNPGAAGLVRFAAPAGIGRVQTRSGGTYLVRLVVTIM